MSRIGSLFSGYRGLDMAVEAVTGGETVWCSDIDPGANKILAHHWPAVPNLGDITAVDWDAVEPVDIITGGFPCRPPSVTGAGGPWCLGDTDAEPALRALGAVLGDLADIGYDAAWYGLTASSVGAPHGRFRVFIIAWPTESITRGQPTDGGDSSANPDDPGREGAQPAPRRFLSDRSTPADTAINGRDARRAEPADILWGLNAVVSGGAVAANSSEGRRGRRQDQDIREGSRDASRRNEPTWGDFGPAVRRWEQLTRSAPAPTETGSKGGQRLSPRFVEFMMGLPDGHVTAPEIGLTRNEQLKALGNGVVVQQAEAAIRHLLRAVAA